jgi:hypothetical protein
VIDAAEDPSRRDERARASLLGVWLGMATIMVRIGLPGRLLAEFRKLDK